MVSFVEYSDEKEHADRKAQLEKALYLQDLLDRFVKESLHTGMFTSDEREAIDKHSKVLMKMLTARFCKTLDRYKVLQERCNKSESINIMGITKFENE